MPSDFKYANQTDLEMYYPAFSQFDTKKQITGWVVHSGTLFRADNVGLVTQFFVNGYDEGDPEANSGVLNVNGEWYYDADLDSIYYYNSGYSATTILDQLFEAGIDNATYFNQMLVNASMELNNLLDRRYPTPIPKYTQYDHNTAHSSGTTEYDAIIIKATCYLCASNLLRTENKQENADYYHSLVTNIEGTGIVDKLNKGEAKLSFEVTSDSSQGKIRTITKAGSMDLVETAGAYVGEPFDLLRITCTTAGAYGVAKVKVEYYGSDKLYGSEDTDNIISGTLDTFGGLSGLYVRFQGASMSVNDQWEIEVYSEHRKITNAESGGIQLTRRGYGL